MKAISELLPWENMVYLADQAHFPYGEKDPTDCIERSFRCAEILTKQDVKLIIVACHTASASALKYIQEHVSIPVIGVIANHYDFEKYKSIGILGTQSTIASKVYQSLILTKTVPLACPKSVKLIENGMQNDPNACALAKSVLKPLIGEVDAALLACTHFPMMKKAVQEALGENIELIDPSNPCAKRVYEDLQKRSCLNQNEAIPTYQFVTTGSLRKFREFIQHFWDKKDGKKQECVKFFLKSDSFFKE